jgi:hypothetical protein
MRFYVERLGYTHGDNDCLFFWRDNNFGYTQDLSSARVFTKDEIKGLGFNAQEKYRVWSKEHLDEVAKKHVRCDSVNIDYCWSDYEKYFYGGRSKASKGRIFT